MAKRVVYQIDPKRRNPDGSFPEFVFSNDDQKYSQTRWLWGIWHYKKHNARKKGIGFNLLFLYFLNFCRRTNYSVLRGNGSADMTIDRIDNLKGYTDDNIQMLSNRDNVRKYFMHDRKLGKRGTG